MNARGWFLFAERLLNPAALAIVYAEGRCLCGVTTSGIRIVLKEFGNETEARENVIHILAELERANGNGNLSAKTNPSL